MEKKPEAEAAEGFVRTGERRRGPSNQGGLSGSCSIQSELKEDAVLRRRKEARRGQDGEGK